MHPGAQVVAHNKPTNRDSWELGKKGWYVVPKENHYRCVSYYFPPSQVEYPCGIVTIFPTVVPFPDVKITDFYTKPLRIS